MVCQGCGVEAETKYVSFHQNIGALIARFSKSAQGRLCKSCIHKHFWGMTGTTLILGWWGLVSCIVTPYFLINNIARYVCCVGMAPVRFGAVPPMLTDAAVVRLKPHAPELFHRLKAGEDFDDIATATAEVAGVTPGQVALFIQAVLLSQSPA